MIFELQMIGVIWRSISTANKIFKFLSVAQLYFKYLYWRIKNPEVKIKFKKNLIVKPEQGLIYRIYESIIQDQFTFSDSFIKTKDRLEFESEKSKLNYRFYLTKINAIKSGLVFETKYIPFYPLKNLDNYTKFTKEFEKLSSSSLNRLEILEGGDILTAEICIENSNNKKRQIITQEIKVSYDSKGFQINGFLGKDNSSLISYLVLDWIINYKKSSRDVN